MKNVFEEEGCLFPMDEIFVQTITSDQEPFHQQNRHKHRKLHCNNLDICMAMPTTGKYEMPVLDPYNGPIPEVIIPFSAATSCTNYHVGVHFYIDDYQFERIWTNIDKYCTILKKFDCVIGPDFSQYGNMSYPMRMWNAYRNRVVSSYLQNHGVKVVPNVTWSLPDSYDYSFDGEPIHSIVAINCTSILSNNLSKYLWYKGYEEALRRLNPKRIIRYGTKMPGEREDISVYFCNERLKQLRDGR